MAVGGDIDQSNPTYSKFTFILKDDFEKTFMEHLLYVSEIKDSTPVSEDHDCAFFFRKTPAKINYLMFT